MSYCRNVISYVLCIDKFKGFFLSSVILNLVRVKLYNKKLREEGKVEKSIEHQRESSYLRFGIIIFFYLHKIRGALFTKIDKYINQVNLLTKYLKIFSFK